ncbi:NADH:flavin oxidoreductase [Clostridium thermarum]|uniref:NADH:flavin oxidoreductase n=1 Tax=Clostridium thermarum TaxID=1716543 RepID=UPI0013D4DA87|nr:NADH:flavin oxidoreductase [Clostridium thermarum]
MDVLFTPQKIKDLEIKNRIVVPPMVCFSFAGEDGFVTEKNIIHYENLAKGGSGLIIVEATCVSKDGRLSPDQLGIWTDDFIEGLSKIAEVCHKYGAKVFIQLHHGGLRTHNAVCANTITSSDYTDGKISSRGMSIEEIYSVQQDFIDATIRAEKAGFDGIELHGAHSYLMTQFFSEKVNKREDGYGGNFENRMRFATEIITSIKKNVKENFILGIRMGCNENGLENSIAMAKKFEALGLDYLHVSTGFDNTQIDLEVPKGFLGNWIVYGAAKIKEQVNIPVIAVNSIKSGEEARFLIDNKFVDLVAIGRAQLADYNFVNHIKEGQPVVKCLGCRPCKWFTNGDNCPRHLK